jgi:hypothetical protein
MQNIQNKASKLNFRFQTMMLAVEAKLSRWLTVVVSFASMPLFDIFDMNFPY